MKSKKSETFLKEEFRKIIDEANGGAQSFAYKDVKSDEYIASYEAYVNNLYEKLSTLFNE